MRMKHSAIEVMETQQVDDAENTEGTSRPPSPTGMSSKKKKKRDGSALRKAPQAPKRFKSSYICFFTAKQEEIKKSMSDGAKVADVSKRSSDMWRNLPPEERAYWDEVAAKDKQRYMAEKATYTGPWQIPKKRAKKDPAAPKRPMSAFLLFSQDKRRIIKEKNPEMRNTEVSKVLGDMWRNATPEEKEPHLQRELKEREQYKKDTAVFNKEKAEREAEEEASRKAQTEQNLYTGLYSSGAPADTPQPFPAAGIPNGDPNSMVLQSGMHPPYMWPPGPMAPVPYGYMYPSPPSGYAPNVMPPLPSQPPGQQGSSNGKQVMVLGPTGMPQYPIPLAYGQPLPPGFQPTVYEQPLPQGTDINESQEKKTTAAEEGQGNPAMAAEEGQEKE